MSSASSVTAPAVRAEGHWLDGNTRVGNGASLGFECRRSRWREVHWLGVRNGAGANRDAALRHSGHSHPVRLGCEIPLPDLQMNASYEWLRKFVPFDLSPTELHDLLTSRC